MRGRALWCPGSRGSPGATTDEQRGLYNPQYAGNREDVRDREDYGEHIASTRRDARSIRRIAGGVATRTSGRLLQGPGEDRAQAGVDHWNRRERRSQGACD